MEDDFRINPDALLKRINDEKQTYGKGHLKIFFGYAAGVGKTYSMLKAAHALKRRNVDVIIGYIEPHERTETISLVNGLEKIPSLRISHKGITLNEFDLDAAIKRKPKLVLVDELAHTNAEGCRHIKRYQDIEELLKSGIDVYTTVNVQHIESLNDIISSITGIAVRERIPDSVFDNADQVELVDIEPEELIERLNSGKIYREAQAKKALKNFFDIKNLTALREIALRRCADRINKLSEKVRFSQSDDYYTDEHILVCLSSSPTNPKIIRTAARMANAFKGSFTALYVETSDSSDMNEEDKRRLWQNMQIARQLDATIETVYGNDIPFQISEFARLSGVSKIVIGRSNTQRKYLWSKITLTERLIQYAPNMDIHIIPDQSTPNYIARKNKQNSSLFITSDVIKSIFILIFCTIIGLIFRQLGFSEANIIMVYILGVLITSTITNHKIYSLVSSIISVLAFNYFFTMPYFSLKVNDNGYPITFLIMLISAFITSTLAIRMKRQMKQASATAYRTKILLETNQLIQKGKSKNEIISIVANQLVKLLKKSLVVYIVENEALSEPLSFTVDGENINSELISANERAVASWVYKNNKHAGASTNTLGNAKCLYLAIRVKETVYGVVGISIHDKPLDTFENSILLSILGECALALQNETNLKEREQATLIAKNEQLRSNLLRSISHDLRTPLTSISGNAGILISSEAALDTESRKQIYTNIYDDSLWLINLVENLLSVTRIEDGTMKLRMTAELICEVIEEALNHIDRRSIEHKIVVYQEDELILARMDSRLIIQVIINIVDNAIKYTPKGSKIVINVSKCKKQVIVDIADNGEGISDEAKKQIFEMFYIVKNGIADSRRSLGLGLALCKSIITAHGGEIFVMDNSPKGTIFRFTLQAEEVMLHE